MSRRPFGKDIRPRHLPTTVSDLRASRGGMHTVNAQMELPNGIPLSAKGAPMGENAV